MFGLFLLITFKELVLGILLGFFALIYAIFTKHSFACLVSILLSNAVVTLVAYVATYLFMPHNTWGTIIGLNVLWALIIVFLNFGILTFTSVNVRQYVKGNDDAVQDDDENDDRSYSRDAYPEGHPNKAYRVGLITEIVLIAFIIVFGATAFCTSIRLTKSTALSVPMTETNSTKNAPMPKITTGTKDSEMPVVNSTETVKTQIENSVSNLKNANVYDVDHLRAQIYHGRMVYIAPLDFTKGYWKYRHYNKIEGYFIVEATSKSATPHFVSKDMKYTPNAYFSKDAQRNLYAHVAQYGYVIRGKAPQLEIDEKGDPYYVATIMKIRGISSRYDYKSTGVAIINAQTGKVSVYRNLKNKPSWLDVAVTPNVASEQVNLWGTDRNGWWNNSTFGSETGVLNTDDKVGTEGDNKELTPVKYHNHIYYFATMTSANSRQTSAFGYVYTDAATGKSYYYHERDDAMTPGRAKTLANDQMRQTQWSSSMPLLYRIDGKPTWVVSMLDSSDAFRSYVYLLASGNGTSNTVATGTDATSALQAYRNLNGVTTASSSAKAVTKDVQGTVLRVNVKSNQINFILAEQPLVVYTINFDDETRAQFIVPGDKVQFKAKVNQNSGTYVNGLNDTALNK